MPGSSRISRAHASCRPPSTRKPTPTAPSRSWPNSRSTCWRRPGRRSPAAAGAGRPARRLLFPLRGVEFPYRRSAMKRYLIPLAAVALALGACSPRDVDRAQPNAEEKTPRVTETEKPGVNAPGDLNPVEAQMRVAAWRLGPEVGPDGAIVTGETGDDFAPGTLVHLSMEVGDTPAGSAIKVVWFGPRETRLDEETQPVPTG